MTKQPLTGPIENPASKAGSSEICISKKLGNINGKLNLAKAYRINDIAVSIAILATYDAENLGLANFLMLFLNETPSFEATFSFFIAEAPLPDCCFSIKKPRIHRGAQMDVNIAYFYIRFFHPDYTVGLGISPNQPKKARGLYRR